MQVIMGPDRSDVNHGAPSSARLIGRNVSLQPLLPDAYGLLLRAELSESLGPLWRLQGNTVPPEQYPAALWKGVTAQFVIHERGKQQPIGLICLYDANHADQFAYLAVADLGLGGSPTRVAQGAALFLEYVFSCWPFRKIYVQTMEYALDHYRSMYGRLLVEEGRLRAHHYLDGRYWDMIYSAIYREAWERWRRRFLAGAVERAPRSPLMRADGPAS